MRHLGGGPGALIEALHAVQQEFGFLPDEALRFVGEFLHVPPARVYGVATFYSYFTLRPPGRHTCVVCTGTACWLDGAREIVDELAARAGLGPGDTTPDGAVSVLAARCVGVCSLAPVVVLDGATSGPVDADGVLRWVGDAGDAGRGGAPVPEAAR